MAAAGSAEPPTRITARSIRSGELSLLISTLNTMDEGAARLEVMLHTLGTAAARALTPEDVQIVADDLAEERRLLAAVAKRLCVELGRPCRRSRQAKVSELQRQFEAVVTRVIAVTAAQAEMSAAPAPAALEAALAEWRDEIQAAIPGSAAAAPVRRPSRRKLLARQGSRSSGLVAAPPAAPAPPAAAVAVAPAPAPAPAPKPKPVSTGRTAVRLAALTAPAAAWWMGCAAGETAAVGGASVLVALVA